MSLDRLLLGEIARDVLGSYRRDLARRTRSGVELPEHWSDVIDGLLKASMRDPMSAPGHALGSVSANHGVWGSCKAGAELMGISERHARRLAATGAIRSRLVEGRVRLIDFDSLRSVLESRRSSR